MQQIQQLEVELKAANEVTSGLRTELRDLNAHAGTLMVELDIEEVEVH